MRITVLLPLLLLTAGCAHQTTMTAPKPPVAPMAPMVPGWITPAEAVFAVNEDPQRGISGTFVFTVKNTDVTEHRLYLNSEHDYRHQLALNVSMDAAQREALQKQLGMPLERLVNRRLLVKGTARRTRIDFTTEGKPTGKYYYQTQVQVYDPRQVQFAP
ncbi:hypothetical protein [uncultured Stenotrophomonas sp.]|uniref:hypothetical protein n=1 Tax=uncultured Stenotrophomonas sp. TaxID=165438 RepID=UPI0028EDDA3C|nr:hypothetical protein [uncultured Stenotrophomonas sp.]